MTTIPMRINRELFNQAQVTGQRNSRSGAQQIDHWARIGRELESAPAVNHRDIERVLIGSGAYDELSEREQSIVRADWDAKIGARIGALNFEKEFTATGRTWADVDADGNLVERNATA